LHPWACAALFRRLDAWLLFRACHKPTRAGGDKGRRQKDNDKAYDTSMKIEVMGDGDIQFRQKLAIILESSRKADLSKLNGQNAC
jgi:hypothetical protein